MVRGTWQVDANSTGKYFILSINVTPYVLSQNAYLVVQFRPADLPSFGIVNFAGKNGGQLVIGVLDRAAEHGLRNPQFEREHSVLCNELVVNASFEGSVNMVKQVRRSRCVSVVTLFNVS